MFAAADPHPHAVQKQAAGQQLGQQQQQKGEQQQQQQGEATAGSGKASGAARLLPDAEKQVKVVPKVF
jgi:hypothetical protein